LNAKGRRKAGQHAVLAGFRPAERDGAATLREDPLERRHAALAQREVNVGELALARGVSGERRAAELGLGMAPAPPIGPARASSADDPV